MKTGKLKGVFIAILFLGVFVNGVSAQNRAECQKIVAATVDAINNKTPEQLENFFASDFMFSGQEAPLANLVFNQLIKHLNEEVVEYRQTDEIENDSGLTLVYEFTYSKDLGHRTTTFVFDSENRLKRLDLLTIQVKTMSNDEPQIEKNEREVIAVPIEIYNNLITATAKINGIDRTFIIDSGSPRLILNSKYFQNTNDSSMSISNTQGVNSSISGVDIVQIVDFNFYGIRMGRNDVLMMDISHLEPDGVEIYGLIGYEIYKDYDILFDYEGAMLVLIQPEATGKYLDDNYKQSQICINAIEMRKHIPAVNGKIGNQNLILGIDCGAGSNLLDEFFAISIEDELANLGYVDLKGAGETKNVRIGDIKELTIGSKSFQNTRTAFNDMSHLNSAYEVQLNGLIGYEILSRQKTLLSYKNKQLIFID